MAIAVKRALSLLDLFTESLPEIGLSDAARLSGHDKATVHRLLGTLREAELVEQDPQTKLYRIGPAVLRLARVREKSTPLLSVVQPLLDQITQDTGETSHFSLYTGEALAVVASCTSSRPNHVALNKMEVLPMHATASGLAYLAFCKKELRDRALSHPLPAFTRWTVTEVEGIKQVLENVRHLGFAVADKSYDEDSFGIAVPILGATDGSAMGALAVAAPIYRMSDPVKAKTIALLNETARELSRRMGFLPPATLR